MKIFNAFSLQMLDSFDSTVSFHEITVEQVKKIIERENSIMSYVGHEGTANIISSILGEEILYMRISGKIHVGESAIIAQVIGGRLPEGCTVLPEGIQIKFILARVNFVS